VLATFIAEGHLERRLRRRRALYVERQAALLMAAGRHLGGLLDVRPTETGLHTVAWLPDGADEEQAVAAAARLGVETRPLASYRLASKGRAGLVLGFVAVPPGELRLGARRLAAALRQCRCT
jgi:GntR family transcriptional regulator/MocR family aminotransferase